ncbi:27448_t:CDS:2, partial [Racocetra persica]
MFQKFIKIQKELLPQFLKETKTRFMDLKKIAIISSSPPMDDTIDNYKKTDLRKLLNFYTLTINERKINKIVWNYSEYYFAIGRSDV